MSDMTDQGDWLEDENVSFDEAMTHFQALGPEPTVGPPMLAGAVLLRPAATSSGFAETFRPEAPQPATHMLITTPA